MSNSLAMRVNQGWVFWPVLAAAMAACSSSAAPTLTTDLPSTSVESTASVTEQTVSDTEPITLHRSVDAVRATTPDDWVATFTIGYGDDPEQLGTAPGGENLQIGPEFGSPGPDGTWWFLDGAKDRVVHYDAEGTYLGEIVAGPDILVAGQFFPYQMPRVLNDGTLIATRFSESSTQLLEVANGGTRIVDVQELVVVSADDGTLLYGFAEDQTLSVIDPTTGAIEQTDWFRSASGMRYRIAFNGDGLVIEQPDTARVTTVRLTSSLDGGVFHGSLEAAVGADDTIHLYLVGVSDTDEVTQLGGYLTVRPGGEVSDVTPIQTRSLRPTREARPICTSHLGHRYLRS
ncbi:MAG: hypothetical protein R2706_14650 [Acidimicrobiales bacterium]